MEAHSDAARNADLDNLGPEHSDNEVDISCTNDDDSSIEYDNSININIDDFVASFEGFIRKNRQFLMIFIEQ